MDDTPFWHLVVIAVIQGITEFLPISSSGHLILIPAVTGWRDQGMLIDVATHVGTLAAVVLYFRNDVAALVRGGFKLLRGQIDHEARLALLVVVATLPVVVAGLLLKETIATDWRSPAIIALTTAVFGVVLWLADRRANAHERVMDGVGWRDAVVIGLAQALALVPGVSRSGITMTAALFLGFRRPDAARFSMLLSIPTILAAGTLATVDLVQSGDAALQGDALLAGGLAFASALAAIAALMTWLKHATFLPFVVYRLLLAALLVALMVAGVVPTSAG